VEALIMLSALQLIFFSLKGTATGRLNTERSGNEYTGHDGECTIYRKESYAPCFSERHSYGYVGGLIGLGGAEFRLPVLVGTLGYNARKAVPLNLAVSLTTIIASLLIRSRTLSLAPLGPFWSAMLAMIAGAVVATFFGASLSGRLSSEQLERVILVLVVAIACTLIVEGFLPQEVPGLLPAALVWRVVAGVLFGLAIGLVSSLLGVAGGELIIPMMVFAFGADIKTARPG
jgi:uncharacterized protein